MDNPTYPQEPHRHLCIMGNLTRRSPAKEKGRNQELALLLALSLEGQHPVTILTLATDGVDGPTDAAGAIVSSYYPKRTQTAHPTRALYTAKRQLSFS